jgi:hypothetical protein
MFCAVSIQPIILAYSAGIFSKTVIEHTPKFPWKALRELLT